MTRVRLLAALKASLSERRFSGDNETSGGCPGGVFPVGRRYAARRPRPPAITRPPAASQGRGLTGWVGIGWPPLGSSMDRAPLGRARIVKIPDEPGHWAAAHRDTPLLHGEGQSLANA